MTFYERYSKLRDEKGLSDYRICKELNIAKSTVSAWKNGKATPKGDNIQKVAERLGTSVEYLLTGKETDGYYENDEVAQIAQEIHDNRELRGLFSAAKDVNPNTLRAVHNFLLDLKREEEGDAE